MTVAMKFVEAGKFSLLRKCFDMALSFAFQILYFGVSTSSRGGAWCILQRRLIVSAVVPGPARLVQHLGSDVHRRGPRLLRRQ